MDPHGPGGDTEISRWREPPEAVSMDPAPRQGCQKRDAMEGKSPFCRPCRGLIPLWGRVRWLTPPANFRNPSGIKTCSTFSGGHFSSATRS